MSPPSLLERPASLCDFEAKRKEKIDAKRGLLESHWRGSAAMSRRPAKWPTCHFQRTFSTPYC